MGWEQRHGRRYYYRKSRQGRRVCSQYVGAGELPEALALLDRLGREDQALEKLQERERRLAQHQAEAELDEARS